MKELLLLQVTPLQKVNHRQQNSLCCYTPWALTNNFGGAIKARYKPIKLPDARRHGERGHDSFSPRELIARAHSSEPRLYIDTIIGSVRDYRIALHWAQRELSPEQIIVLGYSMGAQMSLLLASYEPSISAVVTMVPPYVSSPTSPVAPRIHAPRITAAKVLWLAGTNDTHSTQSQTQEAFDRISSKDKTLTWYDSGHRLPPKFLPTTFSFIDSLKKES